MKARPILFSAPMVRALLAGTKTQTRRVVKPCWGLGPIQNLHDTDTHLFSGKHNDPESWGWPYADDGAPMSLAMWKDQLCPYGTPGDLLWVRETFARHPQFADLAYRADGDGDGFEDSDGFLWEPKYSPSIHMPRSVSRLTLRITEVRVQSLQEISEKDAIAEGLLRIQEGYRGAPELPWYASPVAAYMSLWDSINGPGAWNANPWVWALTFEVIKANVDQVLKEVA